MIGRWSLVVVWIVVAVVAAAHRAHAETTALLVDSQAGDYIGAGKYWSYTPVDATFTSSGSIGTSISLTSHGGTSSVHSRSPPIV